MPEYITLYGEPPTLESLTKYVGEQDRAIQRLQKQVDDLESEMMTATHHINILGGATAQIQNIVVKPLLPKHPWENRIDDDIKNTDLWAKGLCFVAMTVSVLALIYSFVA